MTPSIAVGQIWREARSGRFVRVEKLTGRRARIRTVTYSYGLWVPTANGRATSAYVDRFGGGGYEFHKEAER